MADSLLVAKQVLLVGLGAIPGAWLRLRVVNHFEPVVPRKHWGTFAVNLIAAFGLGLVAGLGVSGNCQPSTANGPLMLLVATGFFGSLSTFSTFVVELLQELRSGRALTALVLAVASIGAGLLACAVGYGLGIHA